MDIGGGISPDLTMEDTGFDSGRSVLAGSWSEDRWQRGGPSLGPPAWGSMVLQVGLEDQQSSERCWELKATGRLALFPVQHHRSLRRSLRQWPRRYRTLRVLGRGQLSIARKSCSISLFSARGNETFSTGGNGRTNGGSLGFNTMPQVPEPSST